MPVCIQCGRENDSPGFKQCSKCRAIKRRSHKKLYDEKKERGICVTDGCHNPAVPGRVRCARCLHIRAVEQRARYIRYRNKYLKRDRERKKKRREEGLCHTCGAPLDSPKFSTCINCRTGAKWPQGTFLYNRSTNESNSEGGTE